MMIDLSPDLLGHFSPNGPGFDSLMAVEGKTYREVRHRRTVAFERGGRRYFIKIHDHIPWFTLLKCLFQGQPWAWGARPEWLGIEALQKAGIRTMTLAGKGERGWPAGRSGSFVITDALEGMISLETLLDQQDRVNPDQRARIKRHLIERLGLMARKMHEAGINHRDFYLCHFLVADCEWSEWQPTEPLELYLIDLHRVQVRAHGTPRRWRVKDLGALMYSAFESDISVADAMRFIRAYLGGGADWKMRYRDQRKFWFRVVSRALGFQREWSLRYAKANRA